MPKILSADDRLNIQDVIAGYAWSLDTGDVDGVVACFARDGVLIWDAFEEEARWEGADELRIFATFLRDQPATAGRQHYVSNIRLAGTDSGADGSAYVAVGLRQGDGPHLLNVMGYYEDKFVQEGGAWKIKQRVIRDWSGPVLKKIAGQTGERVARPRPPVLAPMFIKRGAQ